MMVLRRALGWHLPLAVFAVAMVGMTAVLALAWAVDDRTLMGAPLWAKPLKFAVSFVLYGFTLAWMIDKLPRFRRVAWWAGTVIVLASVIEMVIITGQAIRGVRSHFNTATAQDAALFALMGATVAVIYALTLLIAVLLLGSRLDDPVAAWALRLGVLVALLGMSVGYVMVARQGHSVGVADGGPGLPLVGWSTTGGDLRIGHFVGMHALQALPLVAAALTGRVGRRLGGPGRLRVVVMAAVAHAGLVVLVTWQALRGQPLLSPDATTLAAAGTLLLAVAAGLVAASRPRQAALAPASA